MYAGTGPQLVSCVIGLCFFLFLYFLMADMINFDAMNAFNNLQHV